MDNLYLFMAQRFNQLANKRHHLDTRFYCYCMVMKCRQTAAAVAARNGDVGGTGGWMGIVGQVQEMKKRKERFLLSLLFVQCNGKNAFQFSEEIKTLLDCNVSKTG